jgi:hypothetical protein
MIDPAPDIENDDAVSCPPPRVVVPLALFTTTAPADTPAASTVIALAVLIVALSPKPKL